MGNKMNHIEENVLTILQEFDIHNVNSFKEEINSLTFIELIVKIETTFEITVESDYFIMDKMTSITDICNYIERRAG
jgi:acyl carrier protein